MYRNLECEHHLLQGRYEEKPNIPGLTPFGFERWVTLFIQAHPDKEFERLRKAVLAMPISNPDDEKERFPKEISRRLFPGHEDRKVRTRIEGSMSERAAVGDIAARVRRNKPPIPAPHHVRTTSMKTLTSRRTAAAMLDLQTSPHPWRRAQATFLLTSSAERVCSLVPSPTSQSTIAFLYSTFTF